MGMGQSAVSMPTMSVRAVRVAAVALGRRRRNMILRGQDVSPRSVFATGDLS